MTDDNPKTYYCEAKNHAACKKVRTECGCECHRQEPE